MVSLATADALYLGNVAVDAAYLADVEVWSLTTSAPSVPYPATSLYPSTTLYPAGA